MAGHKRVNRVQYEQLQQQQSVMRHLPEMNTIHQLRSSPKSTHENNTTRVINHLVVDDYDQISIVSPVNELNKEVNDSLVNGPHQINQRRISLPEEFHYSQQSNQQQRIPVRITSTRNSKRDRKKSQFETIRSQ